jgi:hypothetical protein
MTPKCKTCGQDLPGDLAGPATPKIRYYSKSVHVTGDCGHDGLIVACPTCRAEGQGDCYRVVGYPQTVSEIACGHCRKIFRVYFHRGARR